MPAEPSAIWHHIHAQLMTRDGHRSPVAVAHVVADKLDERALVSSTLTLLRVGPRECAGPCHHGYRTRALHSEARVVWAGAQAYLPS
jgi:hypothetical protein